MARKLFIALTVGALMLGGAIAQAGTDPADACKDSKAKATGKKAFNLLKAYGKNQKKPNPLKLGSDVSKAQSKFTKSFVKAEGKGGCLTIADSTAIEMKVDAFVVDVIEEVSPSPSGAFLDATGGALD
jgi:hypothetical protein